MRLIVQLSSLLVRGTALMLGLVGLGMAAVCLGGAFSDKLDAFTHAAPLWLAMGIGAIVLGGAFARGGERWVMVGLGAATLLACSVLMLPELWASWRFKPSTPAASDLKIVQFNIWHENRTPEKSLAWILAQEADVVILEEGGGDAWPAIKGLKTAYPFSSCDKAAKCETWIFSRKKMIARGGMPLDRPYLSGAWATLADAKGPFTIMGVHYTWPVPPGLQQAQSRKLVKFASGFDRRSTIVTGRLQLDALVLHPEAPGQGPGPASLDPRHALVAGQQVLAGHGRPCPVPADRPCLCRQRMVRGERRARPRRGLGPPAGRDHPAPQPEIETAPDEVRGRSFSFATEP
jgi:endonuclease/exonuclease/phosphatase (EEP) superfamily protein YafD